MQYKIVLTLSLFILFIVSCKKNNPVPPKATPEISGFNISTKYVGDATFLIPKLASNSNGAFTYSSSDPAVASIKGDSIQINGAGTVTITAMQAGTASYNTGSITTSFKVLPSVYITGWAYGSSGDQPMYWRNGIATNLSGLGTTNGIFIHNNDVYISGNIQIDGAGYGGYWKNGVPHPIQQNGIVNGIAVLGDDVYAVGYIQTPAYDLTATLWKNDVAIPLTNPFSCCGVVSSSMAWAIAIKDNVVYISGTSFNPFQLGAATIWKTDGSAVALTTPNMTTLTDTVSTAYGITFQGNDMYISGSVGTGYGSSDYLGYWKNGTFFASKLPSHPYPNNTSIVINGSDVYTAGIDGADGVLYAAYWKNNVESILATHATATGIAFSGSDMYVVGTTLAVNSLTSQPSPVYWINGTLVNLPTPVPNNTMATSIFIRN
ncbi:MAG TPA: hypothetical protein VIM89_07430 [Mucilaginibacter sp.]